LGSVTFAKYCHVQFSFSGDKIAVKTGGTYFGPFNHDYGDETAFTFSADVYVPYEETCCVSICGPYGGDGYK
jgi:hypothetical protein